MVSSLDVIESEQIGSWRLRVRDVAPPRFANQREFELLLYDEETGRASPIFRGTYNAPVPAIHVPGWIDGEVIEDVQIGDRRLHLWETGLGRDVVRALGRAIPPGGRMWLAYERFGEEGPLLIETRAGLKAGLPLVTTPLGYLLFCANCWCGLRDWDFPEGGREGPRKLQGNKAWNTQQVQVHARALRAELEAFMRVNVSDPVSARAQRRAQEIANALTALVP